MRDQTRQRVTGFLLSAAAVVALPAVAQAQADTGTAQVQQDSAVTDTAGQDSTKWGYKTNRNPEVQNPPGYRGMERPEGQDTSAQQADTVSAAGQAVDSTKPDSTDPRQSGTPEQRLDPTDTSGTGTDTGAAAGAGDSAGVLPGSTEPVVPDQPRNRLEPGDSADQQSS